MASRRHASCGNARIRETVVSAAEGGCMLCAAAHRSRRYFYQHQEKVAAPCSSTQSREVAVSAPGGGSISPHLYVRAACHSSHHSVKNCLFERIKVDFLWTVVMKVTYVCRYITPCSNRLYFSFT